MNESLRVYSLRLIDEMLLRLKMMRQLARME